MNSAKGVFVSSIITAHGWSLVLENRTIASFSSSFLPPFLLSSGHVTLHGTALSTFYIQIIRVILIHRIKHKVLYIFS